MCGFALLLPIPEDFEVNRQVSGAQEREQAGMSISNQFICSSILPFPPSERPCGPLALFLTSLSRPPHTYCFGLSCCSIGKTGVDEEEGTGGGKAAGPKEKEVRDEEEGAGDEEAKLWARASAHSSE